MLDDVKRSRNNTHHRRFHYWLNFGRIQKEEKHVVVEEGKLSIERINMKKEKTVKVC